MAPRVPARPHHHPSPTERVDDVAPFNTTDRSRELVPRARHLPPSFPNKCNGSPRRPRLQQDRASTPPNVGHDAPSGTEASQKQNAATQYPHPTHPARHPRHESDGRVAPRPNAASQDHKFPQALRNSPRSALAPASTAHLLRGHHALLHVDNGFVEITINFARGGSAGFTSLHLNQNARRIPEETMMVSSTRLDVVVPQAPCVRDVLPIVSGRSRATIRARRATTSSQRSRCPSTRSRLVRARRPSRVATIPHSQWHFTAPPPHSPSLGRPPELSTARVARVA